MFNTTINIISCNMLTVKSKYKIAKRLGAGVFDQTQTQKFALSAARTKKPRGRNASDYGRQLLEKQKVRYTYGLIEKQFSKYVAEATGTKDPSALLHKSLEMRADTVVYRAGLASTRRAARQVVSHGHIIVNGKRITTPSYRVKVGDVLTIREGSRRSPLFAGLAEAENQRTVAKWIETDFNLMKSTVTGEPSYDVVEAGLDYATVFEYYSR